MNPIAPKHIAPFLALLMLLPLIGCSTGIEGTKTIKMSRSDRQLSQPGEEELLISRLVSQPAGAWQPGKRFLVTDEKAALLLQLPLSLSQLRDSAMMKGRVLEYKGTATRRTPGGSDVVTILFHDEEGDYLYDTGRSREKAAALTGLDIPMMLDLDLVAKADSLLRGRRVWTNSRLWYDADLQNLPGKRFVPVTITGVRTGDMIFPLLVDFTDSSGRKASMFMNVNASNSLGAESRTFPALFRLSDPKQKYPDITPEVWERICNGKVAAGMTKEECRLAWGNPSDVNSGHNWDSLLDVWGYKDGSYLQFQDGLLINFRQ